MINRFLKPEVRYARRMARIARWDKPVEGSAGRVRAWANMLLVDHGVFRLVYLNKHRVSDRLWRSAQPAPYQIARLKAEGVRTIINLRGGREHGSWQLQKEACDRLGVHLAEFIVRSREAPSRETLLTTKDFFDNIAYPAILHCKSGADRAGFVAALYLIVHEGKTVDEALSQLSVRYGHFRFSKTGILDAFFESYRRNGEAKGIPFLTWVETEYDPETLEREFRPGFWSNILVDRIMRRE
ncbi:fused DSP-PTPase phosphatase/NAD kinase-like protein [Microvirga alba]|uniref:Tyrosine-protein phosphatase n=1 Tax=Microvirga alba TaxID=2791025 RepID=A0A931FME2_9HYPH|nr:tyrosine-protein phosphatase [Microvirga alba]MBF9232999.1 tyrosine-protein phosphatase [Microvirga alba]